LEFDGVVLYTIGSKENNNDDDYLFR